MGLEVNSNQQQEPKTNIVNDPQFKPFLTIRQVIDQVNRHHQ